MRRFLLFVSLLALPLAAAASSHSEAPLSAQVRDLDITDFYVFRSPDAPATVTFVLNTYPFQEPGGGPNFYLFNTEGVYEIHIDNNGDAVEDITYQFRFRTSGPKNPNTWLYNTGPITSLDDADFNRPQFYTLTRIDGRRRTGTVTVLGTDLPVPPANIGPKSTPNYAALSDAAIQTLPNGVKVWAGQADDPFFVDLGAIFDLGTLRPLANLHKVPPVATAAETPYDYVKGFNVNSIVLQVPISSVTAGSSQIIGTWSTTSAPRFILNSAGARQGIGGLQQVSRLGTPLVNEVVIPLALKDAFNALEPSQDAAVYTSSSTLKTAIDDPELPKLYDLLYGIPKAPTPRADIFAAALTGLDGLNKPAGVVPSEMIRINLGTAVSATPNRMGALGGDTQGFPNGRRLADDVTDILLQVFAGVLLPGMNVSPRNALTDGVDTNEKPFRTAFPYLAVANQGKESRPHP